jgi:cobalt/nickel transport system permease protein
MRAPSVFVMVFEMTYRYVGVLLEEVRSMIIAYRLRSGKKKALEMKHMGSFAGHLLLRGFDRAERVHAAMCCRGYSLKHIPPARRRIKPSDIIVMLIVCVPSVLLRVVPLY